MTLFLDSAVVAEAQQAMALGFVGGITTNPTLMAKVEGQPFDIIAELADICPGPVFYQLNVANCDRARNGSAACAGAAAQHRVEDRDDDGESGAGGEVRQRGREGGHDGQLQRGADIPESVRPM